MKSGKNPAVFIRIIVSLLFLLGITGVFFIPPGISEKAAFSQTLVFRSQLVPGLIRFFSLWSISTAGVIFLILSGTFIFGRFYCSSLCPLGTFQDICSRLSLRRKKNSFRFHIRFRWILRYILFLSAITLLVSGFSLFLGIIEPFSLFSRFLADFLRPAVIKGLIALSPVFQKQGIYLSLEPVLFTPGSMLLGLGLMTAVGITAFLKGRWYCGTICPAGSLLALPASVSIFQISINPENCTGCGACEKICKAGCISSAQKRVVTGDCVLCFSCLSVCSFDAIAYGRKFSIKPGITAANPKAKQVKEPDLSRREFLSKTGWSVLGLGVLLLTPLGKCFGRNFSPGAFILPPVEGEPGIVLPPGAGNLSRFISRCISCHVCISRCPQQVMRPAGREFGAAYAEKPVLDYSRSFCEFECAVCSHVCPAGALLPLNLEEKKVTKLGTAAIENPLCVVYKDGTACGACAEICPTTAVFMIPYEGTLNAPEVTPEICIGCGACQRVCPVEGIKAIRVTGELNHSRAEVRKELPVQAVGRSEGSRQEDRKRLLREGFEQTGPEDPFAF